MENLSDGGTLKRMSTILRNKKYADDLIHHEIDIDFSDQDP